MIVPSYFPPPSYGGQPYDVVLDDEPNSRLAQNVWGVADEARLRMVSARPLVSLASPEGAMFTELEVEINRATEAMLSLQPDWDGEGSGVYHEKTLIRAASFLRLHREGLSRTCGESMPLPTIGPGPDGTVDLFWANRHGKLLVNIPAEFSELATFAGTDSLGQKTKGSFDPTRFNRSVAGWLTTLLGK